MNKLKLTVSPHIFADKNTRYMMKGVLKALVPAVVAGIYFFRVPAVLVIINSITACVLTEYIICKIGKKKIKINDHSAVVTGLLLALVLPPTIQPWMVFLGGVFAIAVGKELFGGLGHNLFNPALLARAFLMAVFPVALRTWVQPVTLDAVTAATPMGLAKIGLAQAPYTVLFLGNVPGSLGETSALALLLGGGYLFYKKIIDYRVPMAYMLTLLLFSGIVHFMDPARYMPPLFHFLGGGFLLGALFMATDPVTTPVTQKGRWIFGAGCGLITMIIRSWGGPPEGVMYSILIMNALTPAIDRVTRPRRYGT